jgi:hypothetical protein
MPLTRVPAELLAAEFPSPGAFDRGVLGHEARMLGLLHGVSRSAVVHDAQERFQLHASVRTVLARAGVLDAVSKMRAHQVMGLVGDRLTTLGLSPTRTAVN